MTDRTSNVARPATSPRYAAAATVDAESFVPRPTRVRPMPERTNSAVSVGPGRRVVTVTPVPRSSWRSAAPNDTTKDLDAAYVANHGPGMAAAVDAVISTRPAPRRAIAGTSSLARWTVATTSSATTSRSPATSLVTNGPPCATPALSARTSTGRPVARTAATSARTPSGAVRSACTATTWTAVTGTSSRRAVPGAVVAVGPGVVVVVGSEVGVDVGPVVPASRGAGRGSRCAGGAVSSAGRACTPSSCADTTRSYPCRTSSAASARPMPPVAPVSTASGRVSTAMAVLREVCSSVRYRCGTGAVPVRCRRRDLPARRCPTLAAQRRARPAGRPPVACAPVVATVEPW
ncbi:hypothetical protein BJF88_07845 [Cellulosimicrobium sp. CUA-896]|nr:hypothetical protein BJF88_07845 [Cellulosimicrobium sp. CUA-896]